MIDSLKAKLASGGDASGVPTELFLDETVQKHGNTFLDETVQKLLRSENFYQRSLSASDNAAINVDDTDASLDAAITAKGATLEKSLASSASTSKQAKKAAKPDSTASWLARVMFGKMRPEDNAKGDENFAAHMCVVLSSAIRSLVVIFVLVIVVASVVEGTLQKHVAKSVVEMREDIALLFSGGSLVTRREKEAAAAAAAEAVRKEAETTAVMRAQVEAEEKEALRDKEEKLSSEITDMQIKLKGMDRANAQSNTHAYDELKDVNYFVENGRAPAAKAADAADAATADANAEKIVDANSDEEAKPQEVKPEVSQHEAPTTKPATAEDVFGQSQDKAEKVPSLGRDSGVRKEQLVQGEAWEEKQDRLADAAKGKEHLAPPSPWEHDGGARPASHKAGKHGGHKSAHPHMVPASHQAKNHKGGHHLRDLRHKHKHHQYNSKKHRHLRREPSVVPDTAVSDSFLEGEGVHKVAEDTSSSKVDGGEMEPLSASGSAAASSTAADVEAATNALTARAAGKNVKVVGMVDKVEDTTAAKENAALKAEKGDAGAHDYFHPHMTKSSSYTYQDDNSASMLEKSGEAKTSKPLLRKGKSGMRNYRSNTLDLDDPIPVELKAGAGSSSASAKFENLDLDEGAADGAPKLSHGERRNVGIRPAN